MTTGIENPVIENLNSADFPELNSDNVKPNGTDNPDANINSANPGEPSGPNNGDDQIGNVNGTHQTDNMEPAPIPTAMDTLAVKRAKLLASLEELDKQENVANLADTVVITLNASNNKKLKEAIESITSDENVQIMYDVKLAQWRYATTTGKTVNVSQPQSVADGSRKRSWFSKLIAPDGTEFTDGLMKTATTNNLEVLEQITGLNLHRDANGNSLSTNTKAGLLTTAGWKFERENNE